MASQVMTRPLCAGDLEAVVALDASLSGHPRRGFHARRLAQLGGPPARAVGVGAERDGRLVGFASAGVLDGEFGGSDPVGVIDAIGVAPLARGAGVATALLGSLEKVLLELGATHLRTQVDWSASGMGGFFQSAGFPLAPRMALERVVETPFEDEFQWEELPVRSMEERDLPAIVRIDRHMTGRDRTPFYRRRIGETLRESGIRLSLVAETDGQATGFLMARIDYGEFGQTEEAAVLDAIGVDPAFAGRRLGRALLEQFLLNLRSLRVEKVITEVAWGQHDLAAFLGKAGFTPCQRLCLEKAIGAGSGR